MSTMTEEKIKILVPVDGSESAERAFDKAVKIAANNGYHVDVLNVIDTRQFMGEMQDTLISGDTIYQMTQDSEEYLKSLKQWAHDNLAFDDIDYHIRYGSPKRIISYDFVKDHGNNISKRSYNMISFMSLKDHLGRSRCSSAVTNPTSIHEDASLIPGLTQWVKDLVLL